MKNTNLIKIFSTFAIVSLVSAVANADQIVYIGGVSKIAGATYTSIGSNSTPAFLDYSDTTAWANYTDGGRTTNIYPTSEDDVVIKRLDQLPNTGVGYDAKCKVIYLNLYDESTDTVQNINVKNLEVSSGYNSDYNGTYGLGTINGFNKASINVSGNLKSSSYFRATNIVSLTVGGNLISSIQQYAHYYTGYISVGGDVVFDFSNGHSDGSINFFANKTANGEAAGIDNANIQIAGVVRRGDAYSELTNKVGILCLTSNGISGNYYTSLGGFKNGVTLRANSGGNHFVVLKNVENCYNEGDIIEGAAAAKLTLVMKGSASQSFNGGSLGFSAGARVISGSLFVNFAETSGVNHGQLSMEGGVFGNSNTAIDSIGVAFAFTDVKYGSGEIKLQLERDGSNALVWDSLSLSTGTIVAETEDKVKINLVGSVEDMKDLIDSVENGGKGIKVISWVSESAIDNADYVSDAFNYNGADYVSEFSQDASGLYVKYVAVPEPATYAAMFALIALGFAWRRRLNK